MCFLFFLPRGTGVFKPKIQGKYESHLLHYILTDHELLLQFKKKLLTLHNFASNVFTFLNKLKMLNPNLIVSQFLKKHYPLNNNINNQQSINQSINQSD